MAITEGVTVPVIVGAAVIDSINPCAFGVLIFILGYLMKVSKNKAKVLADGFGYVIGVYVTYLLLGILIFQGISHVLRLIQELSVTLPILGPTPVAPFLYQIFGVIIIFFGLLEFKEFIAPNSGGPKLAIMPTFAEKVKGWTKVLGAAANKNFLFGLGFSVVMGFLVALVELPCTGAPYIAVIALLTQAGFTLGQSIPLMLAYNFIFIFPLLLIIFIVFKGMGVKHLQSWKNEHKSAMRVAAGMLLIALGLFIFFFDVFFGG